VIAIDQGVFGLASPCRVKWAKFVEKYAQAAGSNA
jgi:hypothetical protein